MSLDDRDWYREAIREKQAQQDNPAPPPRPAHPAPSGPQGSKPRWEPSWFIIPPIALLAGGLAYLLVYQVLSHFGAN
ncbi:hypothetical protein Bsp3421_002195 [Burkholderia sp. FERM BP-3421]|jgi:hypothetical protein|uniref:hypothetical protein n=1 Tax=Burkholderia sp. FERM BP-3421 TaxID=1494466 RepID=UPI002362F543|nr:hypothetical protein [Burkholderia sp. FERM BP-3421]WDD92207.1 hypothetical protein Bsp3421_002195 [Burkholderia sp. FERM BP-3421]